MKERHGEDTHLHSLRQVLSLPALVWKQLAGEEVTWSKDFAAVDLELVSMARGWQGCTMLSRGCSGSAVMAFACWVCR